MFVRRIEAIWIGIGRLLNRKTKIRTTWFLFIFYFYTIVISLRNV